MELEELKTHHIALLECHDPGDLNYRKDTEEFVNLFYELVPDSGEASSIQGELIRSIDRLAMEDRRNGCMNWGEFYINMVDFMRTHLPNSEIFIDADVSRIRRHLDFIELKRYRSAGYLSD